ncbi:MAG: sigma-70 family RNA polymerase sigma factor [Deltaproteobacteria bacterium]|nr:sigma-70 family RNA polymerase sigma factor [Deltaproteobacteria bacterium]
MSIAYRMEWRSAVADAALSREEQRRLAELAGNGDMSAWELLYDAYNEAIKGYFRCRVWDESAHEDLCQDTFIYAYKNLLGGKYKYEYAFFTFLRNLAGFVYLRYLTKMKKGMIDFAERNPLPRPAFSTPVHPDPQTSLLMIQALSECSVKPHQAIAFGFVKLLHWKPRFFLKNSENRRLGDLLESLIDIHHQSFTGGFSDPSEMVSRAAYRNCWEGTNRSLERTAREVYVEKEYLDIRDLCGDGKVRDIPLGKFITAEDRRESSIYDWCHKVKKRIKEEFDVEPQGDELTPEIER